MQMYYVCVTKFRRSCNVTTNISNIYIEEILT